MPSLTTSTEVAAWWGAAVASLVLLLEIFKWIKTRHKLRIKVTPNDTAKNVGASFWDKGIYTSISIDNIGGKNTTISTINFTHYTSVYNRLLNKPSFNFAADTFPMGSALPYKLETGTTWCGYVANPKGAVVPIKRGILVCSIYDTLSKKPLRVVVKIT